MIKVSPFVMVIFGATGDLTSRKLMPALFHLTQQGYLPDRFFIVGFARRNFTKEQFRQMMKEAVEKVLRLKIKDSSQDLKIWKQIENNLYYQQGYFEEKSPYDNLIPLLSSFDKEPSEVFTIDDFIIQLKAMMMHDISKDYGSLEKLSEIIKSDLFIIVSETDMMVNPTEALKLADILKCRKLVLNNDCGHLAPSCEIERVKEEIEEFLSEK